MNRTVRNVGGLILAIILMVSMYGVYRGGTINVGTQAFSTMHRMVGDAFGSMTRAPVKSWNVSGMMMELSPDMNKRITDSVPDSAWKKGVSFKDPHGNNTLSIKETRNGVYTTMKNGKPLYEDNVTDRNSSSKPSVNDVFDQVTMGDANTAKYDPNTRTMTFE